MVGDPSGLTGLRELRTCLCSSRRGARRTTLRTYEYRVKYEKNGGAFDSGRLAEAMSASAIAVVRGQLADAPAVNRLHSSATRSGAVETCPSPIFDPTTKEEETTGLLFAALIGGSLKSLRDESGRARLTLCDSDRGRSGRSPHSRLPGVPLWHGNTPDPDTSCQPATAHGAMSPSASPAAGGFSGLHTRMRSGSPRRTTSRFGVSFMHRAAFRCVPGSWKSGWPTVLSGTITLRFPISTDHARHGEWGTT